MMSDQPSQERQKQAPIDPRDLLSFEQDTPHDIRENVVTNPNDPFVWLASRGVSLGESGNQLMWALFKQSQLSEGSRPTERDESLSEGNLKGLYYEVNERIRMILYEYKAYLEATEKLLEVAPPPAKELQETPIIANVEYTAEPIRLYDPSPIGVIAANLARKSLAIVSKKGKGRHRGEPR
jgi:hypothetical protein